MRGLALPLALLAVWEAVGRSGAIKSDLLSYPSDIALAAFTALTDGTLLVATAQTVFTALAGLTIGAGLGIACGALLGLSARAANLSRISIEVLRPIPSAALIPIAMLVFGFGYGMGISIVAFACFWPALIITLSAVREVPPELQEVARVLELGWFGRLFKIVVPEIVPDLFTAIRLAAGISLVVAVTVEITANPIGLGYTIVVSQETLHPARMFAFLLWVGVLGWLLNNLLLLTQRRLFGRWSIAS